MRTWVAVGFFCMAGFVHGQPADPISLVAELGMDDKEGNETEALQALIDHARADFFQHLTDDGRRVEPEVVALLRAALRDEDIQRRTFAALALRRMGAFITRHDERASFDTLWDAIGQRAEVDLTTVAWRNLRFGDWIALDMRLGNGEALMESGSPVEQVMALDHQFRISHDRLEWDMVEHWLMQAEEESLSLVDLMMAELECDERSCRSGAASMLLHLAGGGIAPDVGAALIESFRDDDVHRNANRALRSIARNMNKCTEHFVWQLEEALKSEDHQQSQFACMALSRFVEAGRWEPNDLFWETVVLALADEGAPNSSLPSGRRATVIYINEQWARRFVHGHPEETFEPLRRALQNSNHGLRHWATDILIRRGHTGAVVEAQLPHLRSTDRDRQFEAVWALARCQWVDEIDLLTEILLSHLDDDNVMGNAHTGAHLLWLLGEDALPWIEAHRRESQDTQARHYMDAVISSVRAGSSRGHWEVGQMGLPGCTCFDPNPLE